MRLTSWKSWNEEHNGARQRTLSPSHHWLGSDPWDVPLLIMSEDPSAKMRAHSREVRMPFNSTDMLRSCLGKLESSIWLVSWPFHAVVWELTIGITFAEWLVTSIEQVAARGATSLIVPPVSSDENNGFKFMLESGNTWVRSRCHISLDRGKRCPKS
jgi:hypothetical protein